MLPVFKAQSARGEGNYCRVKDPQRSPKFMHLLNELFDLCIELNEFLEGLIKVCPCHLPLHLKSATSALITPRQSTAGMI